MMLPNQINSQRFSPVGKGGYRASEVDAFIQKVFQSYNKLFNDNNILKERLSSITPLIDEYNENKKAIANALIWAQSTADKTVSDAKNEAKSLVDNAISEGESIVAEKTAEAEAVYAERLDGAKRNLESATKELELIKNESVTLSEKYISEVNAKANEIIDDANSKASKIVADAYNDAKTARDKADAILESAKAELDAIKREAAKFKKEVESAMATATAALASIEICDMNVHTNEENKLEALTINKDEIEEFAIDFSVDTPEIFEEPAITDEKSKFGIQVETVFDEEIKEESTIADDLISGSSNAEMPDVNTYISKIFESAGSADSDFSSFADDLNDILAQSLDEGEISFEELKKSIDKDDMKIEE